jgi:hypothetical protein
VRGGLYKVKGQTKVTTASEKQVAAKQSDQLMDAAASIRLAQQAILRGVAFANVGQQRIDKNLGGWLTRALDELSLAEKLVDATEAQLHKAATASA